MSADAFGAREWQNGELCTAHGIPYCTACFKVICGGLQSAMDDSRSTMGRIRDEVIRRIREGGLAYPVDGFYRPASRNFFQDSRRRQFAASCPIGDNHIVVPLDFIIVGDENTAHAANDDEMRTILRAEHLWDEATPAWAQNFEPTFSDEDNVLLREMQLFK